MLKSKSLLYTTIFGEHMIPILFNGNKKIFEGLLLSTISLAENTKEPLTIYVMTMDLSDENPNFLPFTDEQMEVLDVVLKKRNKDSKVIKFDATKEYIENLREGKNHKNGYTPYAAMRLLLDLIPNADIPDKLIYLDIDTMCISDIKQLYDIDIEDYDVAAVRDHMAKWWKYYNYCNSGVMLLNFKRIKENGLFDKCRKLVFKKKLLMPDQSAINRYAKKKYIPRKFNEQRKIHPDTVVKHFCEGVKYYPPFWFHVFNIKQWQRDKIHKSKITIFDKYYDEVDELKTKYDF